MSGQRIVAVDAAAYRAPTLGDLRRLIRYAELTGMSDDAVVYTRTRRPDDALVGLGLKEPEPEPEPEEPS